MGRRLSHGRYARGARRVRGGVGETAEVLRRYRDDVGRSPARRPGWLLIRVGVGRRVLPPRAGPGGQYPARSGRDTRSPPARLDESRDGEDRPEPQVRHACHAPRGPPDGRARHRHDGLELPAGERRAQPQPRRAGPPVPRPHDDPDHRPDRQRQGADDHRQGRGLARQRIRGRGRGGHLAIGGNPGAQGPRGEPVGPVRRGGAPAHQHPGGDGAGRREGGRPEVAATFQGVRRAPGGDQARHLQGGRARVQHRLGPAIADRPLRRAEAPRHQEDAQGGAQHRCRSPGRTRPAPPPCPG